MYFAIFEAFYYLTFYEMGIVIQKPGAVRSELVVVFFSVR